MKWIDIVLSIFGVVRYKHFNIVKERQDLNLTRVMRLKTYLEKLQSKTKDPIVIQEIEDLLDEDFTSVSNLFEGRRR